MFQRRALTVRRTATLLRRAPGKYLRRARSKGASSLYPALAGRGQRPIRVAAAPVAAAARASLRQAGPRRRASMRRSSMSADADADADGDGDGGEGEKAAAAGQSAARSRRTRRGGMGWAFIVGGGLGGGGCV